MKQPVISIIVPTKNSESNLQSLFNSLVASDFKDFEIIINDDVTSNDNTNSLVSEFKGKGIRAKYLKENKSMAQGRLVGAHFAKGSILLHLDSDMEVTPKLLAEIADKMKGGSDALVIPEESFGTTFWARCKWLEKKCYEGVEEIESLRAINRELYVKLEGHDESMVFSEDKDLDIRARAAGARVGRTSCILKHNEGDLSLLHSLKKKMAYSRSADLFAEAHPKEYRWQANIFHRYKIYISNYRYFIKYPLTYVGMIFMKTAEYIAAAFGHFWQQYQDSQRGIMRKVKK